MMKENKTAAKKDNSKQQELGTEHLELSNIGKNRPLKDKVFNFIDSHLREIRYGIYGVGVLGCVLILKSVRATSRFRSVGEIPESFVNKNVTLHGNVRYVTDTGTLLTEHLPILQLPTWMSFKNHEGLLPVELIGVTVTPGGRKWLIDNIKERHVWFTVVRCSSAAVQCIVYTKLGLLRKMVVNEQLIKMGCAKVHFMEDECFPDSASLHGRVLVRLLKLESVAERKGLGMWKTENVERNGIFQTLKNFIYFPVKIFRKFSSFRKDSID